MPFEPLRHQAQSQRKEVFSCPLADALIPNQQTLDNLSTLEDVLMVGYPIGLWDSAHNLPILRRGVTVSHPQTNFQDRQPCRYGLFSWLFTFAHTNFERRDLCKLSRFFGTR
jgi:hypothetical protein